MRILALHGQGASATIFQTQLGMLLVHYLIIT